MANDGGNCDEAVRTTKEIADDLFAQVLSVASIVDAVEVHLYGASSGIPSTAPCEAGVHATLAEVRRILRNVEIQITEVYRRL